MPSAKRKFAEIEKEFEKIRKTNHSISSFFGVKERYQISNYFAISDVFSDYLD